MSNRVTKKGSTASGVSSVFGRTGDVVAQSGDYNTGLIPESGNLYFTNARAVTALTGQNISIFVNNAGYITSSRTINTTAPLTGGGDLSADRTIAIPKATTSVDGYLAATDFVTFNNKQPAGNYITALTGDITASGPGSVAATLATVNANVGSFTYTSITVNAKGLVTAASSGSAPEVPLTFSTGLTRTVNTITSNISTGVSGGQTAIGGTASGNNLTLSSTSNGTKGKIIFGSASAYDEVNDRLGLGNTSPASKAEITTNALGTTQVDTSGLTLSTTTTAAVNAQQISPELRFRGFGWKTTATAASQSVDWRVYNLPIQGAAAPTTSLLFQTSINGGGYTTQATMSSTGSLVIPGVFQSAILTPGSVLVAITSGSISQDNANFFWDISNHRLGLGLTNATNRLGILGGIQLRASTSNNYPTTGKGLELLYDGTNNVGTILSYDRDASAFQYLYLQASNIVTPQANVGIGIVTPGGILDVEGYAGFDITDIIPTAGNGSAIILNGGQGGSGDYTSGGFDTITAGNGGPITLTAGSGGSITDETNSTTTNGGVGNVVNITAGSGGNASGGIANNPGAAGNITLKAGNGGSADTPAPGGNIYFQFGTDGNGDGNGVIQVVNAAFTSGILSVIQSSTTVSTLIAEDHLNGYTMQLGFFTAYASPVTQQSGDIGTALSNYGLVTSPTLAASALTGLTSAGITTVVTTVTATNQGADIPSANFSNTSTAGFYRVSYALEDTTSALGAGAVTLTIAYTDAAGSASQLSAALVLTSAGRTQGTIFVQLTSGSISYSTSHTGIFSTAKYALYMAVERIL